LIELVPAEEADQQADVVMATLARFVEHEELESRTLAERLIDGLRSQNLAVAGTTATLDALRWGEVDTLVMLNDYQSDPGWICTACKTIRTEIPQLSECPCCGKKAVRPLDIKEALLRLAAQSNCPVEVVQECDALKSLGGVGCLLRSNLGSKQSAHAVAAAG
jgi:peptide subunit release factor 1 (eRF1)